MANTKSRRALGRGLSSLIPTVSEDETPVKGAEVVDVSTTDIMPNPYQPRVDFDEEEIAGLAGSIETQGLLQPLVVRKTLEGYDIISGERRFRAMRSLGRETIPCIVKEQVSDREMLEMALVENVQRENLNEIEKAHAYQRLLTDCGLSHEQLSKNVGKSRSAVTNALRLLKLPDHVQGLVRSGRISMGHARALLSVETESRRLELADLIVKDGLSVRDVERLTRARGKAKARSKKSTEENNAGLATVDPNLEHVIDKLQYHFGTAVRIHTNEGGKGKIEISYFSNEDLNRILDIIFPVDS